jgi:hypothetical protein
LGRLTGTSDTTRKAAAKEAAKRPIEDRQLVVTELVGAIRAAPTRQSALMSSMPELIGKEDEVAAVVVERLRTIDPAKVEATTPTWLASLRDLPNIKGYLDEVAASNRYDSDVRDAAKNAAKPAATAAKV